MDGEQTRNESGAGPLDGAEPAEIVRAKLSALTDHTASGVAVYEVVREGEDFVFVDLNRAAEKIEHVKRSEVIGRAVTDVFPGVREFGLLEVIRRVWKTGQAERHPISVYRDDRIAGWRENYVCRLPNGQIMAVYDDVTQHKRSELAARTSEQCFGAIANYTHGWEVWIGPTGRVLWTNPAATGITGYTIRELIAMGDYPLPLLHEDDRDRVMRAFRSALKGSTGSDLCFRLMRKDGRAVWVEMSWQPIRDESSSSLGHRQSIRDVTARKEAESALRQAKREKETILDSLTELVVHQDRDLKVLWANRAACESVGLPREQVIGQRCHQLWGEGESPCRDCPVVKAIETRCQAEMEKSTPDGRTWSIQAVPIFDEEGGIIGGAEIALDITKHKRTEEALEELEREYRQLEAETEGRVPRSDETGQANR
jgi:PAS domain S-box-containing protein